MRAIGIAIIIARRVELAGLHHPSVHSHPLPPERAGVALFRWPNFGLISAVDFGGRGRARTDSSVKYAVVIKC